MHGRYHLAQLLWRICRVALADEPLPLRCLTLGKSELRGQTDGFLRHLNISRYESLPHGFGERCPVKIAVR